MSYPKLEWVQADDTLLYVDRETDSYAQLTPLQEGCWNVIIDVLHMDAINITVSSEVVARRLAEAVIGVEKECFHGE